MRFLVDECTGEHSHDVFSVYEEARGMSDDEILDKAHSENWILITNDKDFGEKVHREKRPHHGVVFLRLQDELAAAKIAAIERLLLAYESQVPGAFIIVTESQVRIGRN
jgi:predicted nuclease of predicted toxin-antitoxin system